VPLAREQKQEIITGFATKDGDTGSPEVQIALLTERIKELTAHLRSFPRTIIRAAASSSSSASAAAFSRIS
jgi:ribosomal protein S15